jgi:hypothetical protein
MAICRKDNILRKKMSGEITAEMKVGAVAFLDALGTKGVWVRAEPEEYVKSWEALLTEWDNYRSAHYRPDSNIDTNIKAFSDTVIITVSLKKRMKALE